MICIKLKYITILISHFEIEPAFQSSPFRAISSLSLFAFALAKTDIKLKHPSSNLVAQASPKSIVQDYTPKSLKAPANPIRAFSRLRSCGLLSVTRPLAYIIIELEAAPASSALYSCTAFCTRPASWLSLSLSMSLMLDRFQPGALCGVQNACVCRGRKCEREFEFDLLIRARCGVAAAEILFLPS